MNSNGPPIQLANGERRWFLIENNNILLILNDAILLAKWNNFSVISEGMPVAIIADKNYFTRCKTDKCIYFHIIQITVI